MTPEQIQELMTITAGERMNAGVSRRELLQAIEDVRLRYSGNGYQEPYTSIAEALKMLGELLA